MIDIWEYKFCIGQSIDQYNTKNYSEYYTIGKLATKMSASSSLPISQKNLSNIDSSLHESLEFDGSGLVVRTVLKPKFTTGFLAEEVRQMKEMIEGYQKFEVQFRVVIPNIVQTFADAKILDF